jgi:hypothetical protein
MKRDDGGSAFPIGGAEWSESTHSYDIVPLTGGMTLRDYFAAKAMQGWIASYGPDATIQNLQKAAPIVSAVAYEIADAMLEARK